MGTSAIAPDYKSFAQWAIREGSWKYGGLDGADIQEMALKHGLIKATKYDPAIHGPNNVDAEPGDPWFLFVEEGE